MLAIIPARGGSKGLPGKNIKDICGKPLIAWTIEESVRSDYINDIIVSTDDEQIASIAKSYGARVPFLRPGHLASDDSLAVDTYLYTINRLELEKGNKIEDLAILQPTSPLRTTEDINGAISMFYEKEADSVISCTKEYHPVTWHKNIGQDNRITPIFEDKLSNRQGLPVTYYPNGAIFVFSYNFLKTKKYYSENSYAFIMPRNRSVDIDEIDDFEYAEFLMGKRNAR